MSRFIPRAIVRALVAAAACAPPAAAQTPAPPLPPRENVPAVLTFLSPLLVPKVFQDCFLLREYVRSAELAGARRAYGDLYAVDCVFDRAMRLCWNNVYESLLVSTFAVMDHERFGVRLPLIGPVLWFPLTSEFAPDFRARVDSLPARLYPDTPAGREGDRDKLQHFFGSAFLTAVTESPDEADRFGLFVEWGEDLFIVGGVSDERDVRANRQGERFALRLLADHDTRPSPFFALDGPGFSGAPGVPAGAPPDSLHNHQEAE